MQTVDPHSSALAVIDIQQKLLPAIANGRQVMANAQRLLEAARLLDIPRVFTEQYPAGLGHTAPDLTAGMNEPVLEKMTFDACRGDLVDQLVTGRKQLVVAGCEAHVCVLQTVLGLLEFGIKVFVVNDAVGSRLPDNRLAALQRMAAHGAEIVSTEMVLFEWLGSAEHPQFRQVLQLVK
jgi:nicotinamidase-related amidase